MARSVADELREEQQREILAMTPSERVELVMRLGERDVEFYMATNKVDRAAALAAFRRAGSAGRRPSCNDEP